MIHRLGNIREFFLQQVIEKLGMLDALIQLGIVIFVAAFLFHRLDCFPKSRPTVEEWLKSWGSQRVSPAWCDSTLKLTYGLRSSKGFRETVTPGYPLRTSCSNNLMRGL